MLTLIEKVLMLQEIDVFQQSPTEDLSHIAAITEEVIIPAARIFIRKVTYPIHCIS